MALTGPFSVEYPVNFYSGGDTTKEAFGKHIQEIQRIYGLINSLNADKVSASELTTLTTKINTIDNSISNVQTNLTNHINSSNPHPNWLVNLATQVTDQLSASKVLGTLTNATIAANKVTGLKSYVEDLVPDDITGKVDPYGYLEFPNGIIVQWGMGTTGGYEGFGIVFSKAFPNQCFCVVANACGISEGNTCYCSVLGYTKYGFFLSAAAPDGKGIAWRENLPAAWIAIGN